MDVDTNQPLGTPTWIDLGVPDLDRALAFYGAVFGWEFDVGPEETGRYTMCFLRGRRVAAISAMHDPARVFWNVYLATDDCDRTAERARAAGGTLLMEPMDVMDQGRMADRPRSRGRPVRAVAGPRRTPARRWSTSPARWCATTWSPRSPGRPASSTPRSSTSRSRATRRCRGADFTFLRRPDGHEVGGIMGAPGSTSAWSTTFEVAGTDEAVQRALDAGGRSDGAKDFLYGRLATITDPFGAEFSIITRPGT